jgi:hypothetical protein
VNGWAGSEWQGGACDGECYRVSVAEKFWARCGENFGLFSCVGMTVGFQFLATNISM